MQKFIGTGVALITPFKNDLSVDFKNGFGDLITKIQNLPTDKKQ